MAVVLRLARHGQKKRPFYRIVAAEKQMRRNGRFIEVIGTYNPMTQPAAIKIDESKVRHWVELGAHPSDTVRKVIIGQIPGYIEGIEAARIQKTQAKRRKRKEKSAQA
jgi:small subunit ribosomal protein S16